MSAISRVEVIPVKGALGADIIGFDINNVSDEDFSTIRAVWMKYLVLRIRGQKFDDDAHLAFGRGFGDLELSPKALLTGVAWHPDYPELSRITNIVDKDGKKTGTLGNAEAYWHTDMNYLEEPPMGSMLHAFQLPSKGGRQVSATCIWRWKPCLSNFEKQLMGKP
jgi:taurine dioxygenase